MITSYCKGAAMPAKSMFFLFLFFPILAQKDPVVVPEHFLREFDPITIFLAEDRGPMGGGPLDKPDGVFLLDPPHPGEFRWLDASTLQFQPTIPWPALSTFRVGAFGSHTSLITFMNPPIQISPQNGARNLPPLRELTLSFTHPMDPKNLAGMLSFQVKPLPGTGNQEGYQLSQRDFTIKTLERSGLDKPARYALTLHKTIPQGQAVELRMRLALDPSNPDSLASFHFNTKPLFRLERVGSGSVGYPVSSRGSVYAREQALPGGKGAISLFLQFNDALGAVSMEQVKRLVHFEPAVRNLAFRVDSKRLLLTFDADRDHAHRLVLQPTNILDQSGRGLTPFGETSLWFYFDRAPAYVRWRQRQGILERFGPQQLPMETRDTARIDLRIYKIDPLARKFWPFHNRFHIDESSRPPGPGEEPDAKTPDPNHIRLLDSPPVSRIVDLAAPRGGADARLGLDLKAPLAGISGAKQPGTYLVGYRPLGAEATRTYARVQVTDLSLSTIEGVNSITFAVHSLQTGLPITGAEIRVQGLDTNNNIVDMITGRTTHAGLYRYHHRSIKKPRVFRIVVSNGADRLVLDPQHPPPEFYDNHFFHGTTWLGWLNRKPNKVLDEDKPLVHLYCERPVYRPEEPVHLKGYLRYGNRGALEVPPSEQHYLVVNGPGEKRWEFPVTLVKGSFYHQFDEKKLPSGNYTASLKISDEGEFGFTSFKKEAYRIPRFEVRLSGPKKVPLDKPFSLKLLADYYAGGRVVGQEVTWQINSFPYRFGSSAWPDYLFSTDERFTDGAARSETQGETRSGTTDENGSAKIELDPTANKDSRPKRYVIQGTVRGADEQTVSTTQSVLALPPFVLGIKLDRFLEKEKVIKPKLLVLDHKGEPLVGKEVQVRLLQRQWHSYLRESDFSTGSARYVTDVVDIPLAEKTLTSEAQPLDLDFPVEDAGVYLVEMVARDRLGRMQKVVADLFVRGETAVAWQKPRDAVFSTTWDKDAYVPGEKATLLLKSPFQEAYALVVVEAPEGNRYHGVNVANGQGFFEIGVEKPMTSKIAVHAILYRGRVGSFRPEVTQGLDLGKPKTMMATAWLKVKPKDFQLQLALKHPEQALPGTTAGVTIEMTDPDGNPLDGEVTLWLVDRAVLALGKEARLDPHSSFVADHRAWARIRGTRNEVVGGLPVEEFPGGDGSRGDDGLLGKVTVRKNFKTVPYYNALIQVVNGTARVEIELPDNLTDFAVRAVATDNQSRFGATKSKISIRLPVIVQSALPRFVRPGDRFVAGGIGRVVEGQGGPGKVEIQAEGANVDGDPLRKLTWVVDQPERVFFPMEVTVEAAHPEEAQHQITLRLAVSRDSDGASDAFELKLPVKPDRDFERTETFAALDTRKPLVFEAPKEAARPGTLQRSVLLTVEPALIKMLSAMDYLSGYPHGCTEQRISRLMPELALKSVFDRIGRKDRGAATAQEVKATLTFLSQAQAQNGLFGYWPGSDAYVSLTAYVVEFLVLAREQGYDIEDKMMNRALTALTEAMRSDYSGFIDGHSYGERTAALAALARAGSFDRTYGFELAARARNFGLNSEANILHTLLVNDITTGEVVDGLGKDLWESMIFAMRDGIEAYQGLQFRANSWGGLILSSEARTVAAVVRALHRSDPSNPRLRILVDELISLGRGDGWGSTNANAAAMLALGEVLDFSATAEGHQIRIEADGRSRSLDTGGHALTRYRNEGAGEIRITHDSGPADKMPLAWLRMAYLPAGRGHEVDSHNAGFVLERELFFFNEQAPPVRHEVKAGGKIEAPMGTIIEEHVRVINPEDRFFVAVRVPFAAGLEPMNPNLATSPKEAKPRGNLTQQPAYALFEDDQVTYYYDSLAKGTYDFYFRLRASIEGDFTHPAARAEMMYRQAIFGRGAGTRLVVLPRKEK